MADKIEWDEVRDELIQDFCNIRCPDYVIDYQCPDHNCPVWKLLDICARKGVE